MPSSSGYILPISRRGHQHQILPKAYDKSERLDLDFWDPRRLAAHVLATLSPADQRGKAADLILERQITGSFLARYTRQIEDVRRTLHEYSSFCVYAGLLDGEGDSECELIRAIARTVSKTFWVPLYEPRAFGRYDTFKEIVRDLRRGASCVEDGSSSVAGSAAVCSAFEKEEEENVELHELIEEGAELTEDEIGTRERQDDDDAGCGGGREEGGTSGAGDGDRDRDGINYYDLRLLLTKIESSSEYAQISDPVLLACSGTTQRIFLGSHGEAETETGHVTTALKRACFSSPTRERWESTMPHT